MLTQKNEAGTLLPMTVTEGVTVNVIPNREHEYLMPTSEVALGYGISESGLRHAYMRHGDELLDGKHWLKGVTISPTLEKGKNEQPNQVFWTKRGIVRLGFFVRSERAKLFRNWAEDLIINNLTQPRSELIKKAMDVLGGQRRLAEHIGVGESTLSEIANGKGRPGRTMTDYVMSACEHIVALGYAAPVQTKRPVVRERKAANKLLTSILIDVCRIEDTKLRMSIVNKLMGGRAL